MKRLPALFLLVAAALPAHAARAADGEPDTADARITAAGQERVYCLPGWESFLPGDYYACRARYHLQRNHPSQAVEMLREAAYWANKDAQHSLGLAYVNGDIAGIGANRPLGVAWLGLAAERRDPAYLRDYSVAAAASSRRELDRAARIYLRLRKDYGDQAAGPRAIRRFIHRIKPLDDAAAMGGNFAQIPGLSPFPQGALDLSRMIHARAYDDFVGLQGRVTVGALERVEAPNPALLDKYREAPATGTPAKPAH